jgi:hypothetical protein
MAVLWGYKEWGVSLLPEKEGVIIFQPGRKKTLGIRKFCAL